jgi:protein-tyrosine-phosphatase
MSNHPEVQRALKKVINEINEMTPEQFEQELFEHSDTMYDVGSPEFLRIT